MEAQDLRLLTPRQTASVLGQDLRRVYRWIEAGELPGVIRIGQRAYVVRAELEQWIQVKVEP